MKSKVSYEQALNVAQIIVQSFAPFCERITIAGSIRREKPQVSDIELVYIPKFGLDISTLFGEPIDLFEENLTLQIGQGMFTKRLKINGTVTYGPKVKLLTHVKSSIPVDLFKADAESWYSLLIARTGGKTFNETCAKRAISLGYNWLMGGHAFKQKSSNKLVPITSEFQFFEFLNLPYLEPKDRP